jgi:hypothetical protein
MAKDCHESISCESFERRTQMETSIKQLDESKMTYLLDRVEDSFKQLSDEFGIAMDIDACSYTKNNGRFQVKLAVLDPNGKPRTEERESFKNYAQFYGLKPTDLDRKFIFKGKAYTICGLSTRSKKYPILAMSDHGHEYKFACMMVLQALGKKLLGYSDSFQQ